MTGQWLTDYLGHMQVAASDACSFVEGLGQADFHDDKRTQSAVVMSLIVIGEAATKVMDQFPEFAAKHNEISWRSMRGMRNRIAHGYFLLRFDVIWDTVSIDLPVLIERLNTILDNDKKTHGQS